MELIWQGIVKAIELVFGFDAEVWAITWLSLKISGSATLISLLLGVPLGIALALTRFRGRDTTRRSGQYRDGATAGGGGTLCVDVSLAQRALGFSGTDLFADGDGDRPGDHRISHSGRLDHGEFPRPRSETSAAIARHRRVETATVWLFCKEARLPLLAAVMAGFGGVISEVGASMMVGGNIRGQTRVLTTATVLETGKGNFDIAIALGLILLALTFAINFFLTRIQQREQLRWPKLS